MQPCTHASGTCGGQRSMCQSLLFPSTIWGPDTNSRSPTITVFKELACQFVAALLRMYSHLQEQYCWTTVLGKCAFVYRLVFMSHSAMVRKEERGVVVWTLLKCEESNSLIWACLKYSRIGHKKDERCIIELKWTLLKISTKSIKGNEKPSE